MIKKLKTAFCITNYSDTLEELDNETVLLLKNKIAEYNNFF